MSKPFLTKGNGYQTPNRRRALEFVRDRVDGLEVISENTIRLEPYGLCHFAAYTHEDGAMISTPNSSDSEYGGADWHSRDHIMMFRDFGDGRVMYYVCPIKALFDLRTIGHHGVKWPDVQTAAKTYKVFKV